MDYIVSSDDLKLLLTIVSAVFPLECYEANEDCPNTVWQYDGGLDGVVVCVNVYTNYNKRISARVHVDMPAELSYDLWSCPIADVHDNESVRLLKEQLITVKQGKRPF